MTSNVKALGYHLLFSGCGVGLIAENGQVVPLGSSLILISTVRKALLIGVQRLVNGDLNDAPLGISKLRCISTSNVRRLPVGARHVSLPRGFRRFGI